MEAREKLLEAASESFENDASVGQILELISQSSKFRDELGDGLAFEAVSLCQSSSAAERMQSILVATCIIESNIIYHNDETSISDLLLALCEALSELLLSHHLIFDVSRRVYEEAFLEQTSKLDDTEVILSRSIFSSFLLVDAFREVALFPRKYKDVNPGLSFPAILYAHLLYDIGSDASSPNENAHRQIIDSYATLLDGIEIDPKLFKQSQSIVNGISISDFHACIAPILCGNLEDITTPSEAISCLRSCSNLIALLINCEKGHYLERYCLSDDGVVSIMVDTSMELLIEMMTEDAAIIVSNLLNVTVLACHGLGLLKVSEALLDALNVDTTIFANVQECQGFVKHVTHLLCQVALVGVDSMNKNDATHHKSYKEELGITAEEIIQTLRVIGDEETNPEDALRAWEEVYTLFCGGDIDIKVVESSMQNGAVETEPNMAFKAYEVDLENECKESTEQNYEIRGVPNVISVSAKDKKEGLHLGKGKAKILLDEANKPKDEPSNILMGSIEDRIHAKLKATNISASADNMDKKIPALPFPLSGNTSAAGSRVLDVHSDSGASSHSACDEATSILSRSHQGAKSIEDRIHAKLKSANASLYDDTLDTNLPAALISCDRDLDKHTDYDDSSLRVGAIKRSIKIPHLPNQGTGSIEDRIYAKLKATNVSASVESINKLSAAIYSDEAPCNDLHTRGVEIGKEKMIGSNHSHSDNFPQSNFIDNQRSLLASESSENIALDRRINSKLTSIENAAGSSSLPLPGIYHVPCKDEDESQRGCISSATSKPDGLSIDTRVRSKLMEEDTREILPQRSTEAIIRKKIDAKELLSQEISDASLQSSSQELSLNVTGLDCRISTKLNPSTRLPMDQHDDTSPADDLSQELEVDDSERDKRIRTKICQFTRSSSHDDDALVNTSTAPLIRESNELSESSSLGLLHQPGSDSERLTLLDNQIPVDPSSHTTAETDIPESPKSIDKEVVVAMAIEDGEVDDLDEAVNYDPNSKKKLGKKITCWTSVAIVAAGVVAAILIFFLSKQKLKANEDEVVYAPSAAPSSANQGEISRLIIDRFGTEHSYYDISTAYGKAFEWITQDEYTSAMIDRQVLGKLRRQNEISFDLHERFFCSLFYYEMKGDRWVNCSASFDFRNETCITVDRENQLRRGRSKWLSNVDVCAWAGISCDSNKKINVLDLNHLALSGMIPAEIGELKELQILSLINNTVYGHIPREIGKLSKLLDVDLHLNRLFGEIPIEFYSLSKMLTFNLGYNYLNGTLSPKIGKMSGLKGFHLKENLLSGPIPKEIGSLGDLHYLTLSGNSFTDLPIEFEQLTKLRSLLLDKNVFQGPLYLPVAEDLKELSIDNNYFNESLPENLYKLKDLEYLVANNNKFTGTLQPEIGALTKLRLLQLRNNNFHGNLPSSMKNLLEVVTLSLNFNAFSGRIPMSICDLYKEGNLMNFILDCKNDLLSDDQFYGAGKQKIKCPCCTHCCDPGIESDCQPKDAVFLQFWMP